MLGILILISSFFYAASFYIPYCWWMALVWPVFFIYAAIQPAFSVKHCIIWAVIAMGLHCAPIVYALTQLPNFLPYYLLIGAFILIGYATLICCIVLLPTIYILQKRNLCSVARAALWAGSLTLLFLLLTKYGFLPFGIQSGYSLFDPLIPLIRMPELLCIASHNQTAALILFFATAATAAITIQKQTITSLATLTFLISLWIVGCAFYKPRIGKQLPVCIQPMPRSFSKAADPLYVINSIQEMVLDALAASPTATTFIFPESAVGFCLSDYKTVEAWGQNGIGKPVHLIIGGIRKQQNNQYNCVYWFYDGTLQLVFDKRFPVPLVECQLARCPEILLLRTSSPICMGSNPRPEIVINDEIALVPYICSDLFFNTTPDDEYPNTPILAVCNDTYSPAPLRNLMRSATHYKAVCWKRSVVYIDYHHSCLYP